MGFNLNLVRLTESYALCLGTEGKSTKTITWYTTNLKRFAQFLSDRSLRFISLSLYLLSACITFRKPSFKI